MRRLHRTVRAPFAWLALLVLAVPLVALAQDLQGPGFAYYEAGDLDRDLCRRQLAAFAGLRTLADLDL